MKTDGNITRKIKNKEFAIQMRKEGKTDSEIARALVDRRNEIRLQSYLNQDGTIKDEALYKQAREHCLTYKELRAGTEKRPKKTDQEIIESSMRANPGMDACCGLYDDYFDTYGIIEITEGSPI